MLTVFRVTLLMFLSIDFLGCIGGNKEEQRNCLLFFGIAGVLFLLSFLI